MSIRNQERLGQDPQERDMNSEDMAKQFPWHSCSWRRIPYLVLLCMLCGCLGMAISIFITIKANNSKVDTWYISPTVLLSICAAISTMMVRAAFGSATDIFWWSTVCSRRGVDVAKLHAIWDIAHNPTSLAAPSSLKTSPQPLLRSSASLVLLMAIVGPLLQRAMTVKIATEPTLRAGSLPIRRAPMWNLTTQGGDLGGFDWTIQPYEETYAQVAEELQQRRPIVLGQSWDACPANSTCTTNVTVAGFRRTCSESSISSVNITSLKPARYLVLGRGEPHTCPTTGSDDNKTYCDLMDTRYQLEFLQIYPPNGARADNLDIQYDNPEDLGLDRNLPPAVLGYTSYTRQDINTDIISVMSCKFATAFVSLPIQITDRNIVTLLLSRIDRERVNEGSTGSSNLQYDTHTIELIPSPFLWSPNSALLDGIRQTMTDLYGGFTLLDTNEGTQVIQGLGPRQFINQSSMAARTGDPLSIDSRGIDMAYLDPLDAFTDTLEEISLRYAVKSLPTDQGSREKLEKYIHQPDLQAFRADNRTEALKSMRTRISYQQDVTFEQSTIVAIYKVNYVYTLIAVGCVYLEIFLIVALLQSWKRLGRDFSMSPLEIAKAFNAPLLSDVNSNSTGAQISRAMRKVVVRYGESSEASATHHVRSQDPTHRLKQVANVESTEIDADETANLNASDHGAGESQETRKLLIDTLDHVRTPPAGRKTYYG